MRTESDGRSACHRRMGGLIIKARLSLGLAAVLAGSCLIRSEAAAQAGAGFPDPIIELTTVEQTANGVRYYFRTVNWSEYAPEMFAEGLGGTRMAMRQFDELDNEFGGYASVSVDAMRDGRHQAFVPHGSGPSSFYVTLADLGGPQALGQQRVVQRIVRSNVVTLQEDAPRPPEPRGGVADLSRYAGCWLETADLGTDEGRWMVLSSVDGGLARLFLEWEPSYADIVVDVWAVSTFDTVRLQGSSFVGSRGTMTLALAEGVGMGERNGQAFRIYKAPLTPSVARMRVQQRSEVVYNQDRTTSTLREWEYVPESLDCAEGRRILWETFGVR